MRTKMKYRENKSDIPVEDKSPVEAAIIATPEGPPAVVAAAIDQPAEQPQPILSVTGGEYRNVEAPPPEPAVDDTALALSKQVEALKRSEQLQAAHMAQQQQPLTREQKLVMWRRRGLTDKEMEFLKREPQLIDHSAITNQAAAEALQAGHERDSVPYFEAVKMNFNNHLARLQAQAATSPAMQTPEFFKPPASPRPQQKPSIVSAPVSRQVPDGNPRPAWDQDPKHMTLTREQAEIAKASGISLQDYARNLIRLEKEKAQGVRQ